MRVKTIKNLIFVVITLTILYPQTPLLKYESSLFEDSQVTGDEVDPFIVIDNNNNLGLCYTRLGNNNMFGPTIKYAYEVQGNMFWTHEDIYPYDSEEYLEAQMYYIGSNRILSFRYHSEFEPNNYILEGGWSTFLDPNTGSWQEENSEVSSFAHTSYMDIANGSDEIHFLSMSNYYGTRELRYFKRNSNGTYTPNSGYTVVSSNNVYQGAYFDLTIGDGDTPYFCYREGNNLIAREYGENPVTVATLTEDYGTWNRKMRKMAPPTIAYNGNSGILMIAFSDYDNATGLWSLFYSIWDNAGSTWSNPEKVFNNTVQMTYPYLSADINSGNFFLSYYSFDDSNSSNHVYLNILGYSETEGNFGNNPIEIDVGELDDGGYISYKGHPIHSKVKSGGTSTTLYVSSVYFGSDNNTDVRLYEIGFQNSTPYTFRNMVIDEDAGGNLELTNNTTGTSQTDISGTQRSLTFGDNYSIETLPRRYDDYNYNGAVDDYQHHHWDTDNEKYLLSTNFYPSYFELNMDAIYSQLSVISLNSNPVGINFEIHDPWYYDETTQTQLDEFRPLSDQDDGNGILQIFLNQNDQFNTAYPIYRLKAPNLYATENAIYEFTGWHGNNIKFNIDGDPETDERITNVVFTHENAWVTAEYIVVNDQPAVYQVPEDDELIIPPGANIDLAEGFKIEVDGTIIMDGGNSRITLNGNTNQPWSGIQVNGTGQIKLDNVVISNVETALLLDVNSLDNIIDHHISNLIVSNSNYGIDIKTGTLFSPADLEEGAELTPLTINNCEFGGINNTAIRWQADPYFGYDNGFIQLGKLAIHNCKFIISEQGIDINGLTDFPNDFYASSDISYNYFSNCNYPVSITSTSIGPYYWYPTLVVPEPQEWNDDYDPEYALKNIISYNRFYDYETALKVDGDVLLLTHHNLYDGGNSPNTTAIDLTAYTEPPTNETCTLHSHIIGNETIVNNSLGIKALISNEGNRVNCYTMIVDNTIFYENTDNYDAPGSDLYVDYATNILEGDPMFIGDNNYHLSPGSPAIDSGTAMDYDLDGAADLDPDGSPLEMGAYYYQLPSTSLSFSPNMQVGDFPMFEWTPVNVGGGVVYYDIYYHGQNFGTLGFLATTQTTSYMDIRYIVAEIEEGGNGGNDRRVKVRKNEQAPPEQEVIEIYYSIIARDEASHNSPPSNEIMARVIRAPNPKEMAEELFPEKYDLSQGFPNPFNPAITLPYALPDLSTVVIHVYDITGRRVATLKNQMEEAGYHKISWDGRNKTEKPLSSGMYIIQLTAKSMESDELFTKAQKVVLLK